MTVAAKRRRGRPPVREERVEPTPETLAKLEPDPLQALLDGHVGRDLPKEERERAERERVEMERATDEIRAVYHAVVRAVMRKPPSFGDRIAMGKREMPGHLAWAHSKTYLPWAQSQHPRVMEACIDIIIDRRPVYRAFNLEVIAALRDYAKRMTERKPYRGEENS